MLNYQGQINYNPQFNEQTSIFNRNKNKNDDKLTTNSSCAYNLPENYDEIQIGTISEKFSLRKKIGIGLGLGSTLLLGAGLLFFLLGKGNFKAKVDILNKESKKINLDYSKDFKFLDKI